MPQAGHKTAYSILSGLGSDYNITAVFFVNTLEKKYFCPDDYAFCSEYYLIPVNLLSRIIGVILHPFLPLRPASRANIRAVWKIREFQEKTGFDTVHFEFTAAGYYRQFIKGEPNTVYSEHDITYQSYERRKLSKGGVLSFLYNIEYLRQKKWELGIIGRMNRVLVHNDKDRLLIINDGVPAIKLK